MKNIAYLLFITLLFIGCSKKPKVEIDTEQKTMNELKQELQHIKLTCESDTSGSKKKNAKILFDELPRTYLSRSGFDKLPNWDDENYISALNSFVNSCKTSKTRKMYKKLCKKAKKAQNAKQFLQNEFAPYEINTRDGRQKGLLTGYYEPHLKGSLEKKGKYKYPIYETPKDLITVDLGSVYPQLKNLRLRGRLEGNKLVPYYTRKETKSRHVKANVICYTDSKIDRFFLEIQGSGRVTLDNGETIFIGYDNQNGHRYRAIGRYLVKKKALKLEEVSLQTIRAWLEKNPKKMDEVLNYNKSVVYFKRREQPATGSLGVKLTPKRSIAVDRRYIPLGSMLYLNAELKKRESISKVVLAQDTGGAIKGSIRADLFLGYGKNAMEVAGELKAPLQLWLLLPKEAKVKNI